MGLRDIQNFIISNLVKDSETAVELSTTLIRRNFGEDALNRQQPLSARDEDEYWAVEGSPSASKLSSGFGSVHLRLKKIDASVDSLYWDPPKKISKK